MSDFNQHRAAASLKRAQNNSKHVARIAREIEEAAETLGMDKLRRMARKIRDRTNESDHAIPDYIERALEEMPN